MKEVRIQRYDIKSGVYQSGGCVEKAGFGQFVQYIHHEYIVDRLKEGHKREVESQQVEIQALKSKVVMLQSQLEHDLDDCK